MPLRFRSISDRTVIGKVAWPFHAGLPFLLCLGAFGESPPTIPTSPPKARYEALRAHSPFSLATGPIAAPLPQASFAANWYVAGVGRIGTADFVVIKSRDLSVTFSISSGEIDPATGVGVASVNWSEAVGKSTVVLRKGGETAQLEFNEAELRKTAPVSPVAPVPPVPTAPNRTVALNAPPVYRPAPSPPPVAPDPLVAPDGEEPAIMRFRVLPTPAAH
jgi:hypothetical protein